jgi:hypothetical protein
MKDVIVLVVMVAFTLLCVAYVRWCDRIIGPAPEPTTEGEPASVGEVRP